MCITKETNRGIKSKFDFERILFHCNLPKCLFGDLFSGNECERLDRILNVLLTYIIPLLGLILRFFPNPKDDILIEGNAQILLWLIKLFRDGFNQGSFDKDKETRPGD